MEIRIKKGFNPSKFEEKRLNPESPSNIEARRKNGAYLNEVPLQFLFIIDDLLAFNRQDLNKIKDPAKRRVEFYKHIMTIIEKCEFYEFSDEDFKKFVSALKEFGCQTYEEAHPSFKPTGSRELTETVSLPNNIEAPLEITDRLLKAENFESTRTLIQNGALRAWLSTQEKHKTETENQSKNVTFNRLPDETIENTPTGLGE